MTRLAFIAWLLAVLRRADDPLSTYEPGPPEAGDVIEVDVAGKRFRIRVEEVAA